MKEKINLYVDDLRDCPQGFVVARTVEEAIELFNTHEIGIISFDNDMGQDENGNSRKEGNYLATYMCKNGIRADKIYIHTDNPVERDNIYKSFLSAQRHGFIDESVEVYRHPLVPNKYTI